MEMEGWVNIWLRECFQSSFHLLILRSLSSALVCDVTPALAGGVRGNVRCAIAKETSDFAL